MIHQEIHTDESIAAIDQQCRILIKSIEKVSRGGNEWKLPKIFRLRLFAESIKRTGCASLTNTGPQERHHKDLKISEGFTNNHRGQVELHFRHHSTREAAAKRVLAAAEPETKQERTSMAS
jgi:hypothetical protein